MDPILKFIGHYYYHESFIFKDLTIDSFFNKGYFAKFVVKKFNNGHCMYNVILDSTDEKVIGRNNMIALRLISKISDGLINAKQSFQTIHEKAKLLELIITKISVFYNQDFIFKKCKKLFEQFNITISRINDLFNKKSYLTLLSILTSKSISEDIINDTDFDQLINNYFTHDKLPIFIDSSFFYDQYNFLLLIQYHLILFKFNIVYVDPLILFLKYTFQQELGGFDYLTINDLFSYESHYFEYIVSAAVNYCQPIFPEKKNQENLEDKARMNKIFENISKIIKHKQNNTKINKRNKKVLLYLCQKRPGLISPHQQIQKTEDKFYILKLILTKVLFTIDSEQIFKICKEIFQQKNLIINNENDLFTKKSLLQLLNIVKNEEFSEADVESGKFNQKINYFNDKDYKLNLFIKSFYFQNEEYKFLVMIQFFLILNHLNFIKNNPITIFLNYYSPVYFGLECLTMTNDYFFDDGYHFPLLVSLVLNNGKSILPHNSIVDIKGNIENNNKIALNFLIDKRPKIFGSNQLINSSNDKFNVLKLIISKIIYDIDSDDIFNKCQKIFERHGIENKKFNELFTKKSFCLLIKFLIEESNNSNPKRCVNYFSEPQQIKDENDFDIIKLDYVPRLNIPFFINESFFDDQYHFLLLIQFYLILKFFGYYYLNPIMVLLDFNLHEQFSRFISYTTNEFFKCKDGLKALNVVIHSKKIPYLKTIQEKNKYLELVITKELYTFDIDTVFIQCKRLFEEHQIKLKSLDDLLTKKSFILLLYFLDNQTIQENSIIENDFDTIIYEFRQKNRELPLFIKSIFFEDQYHYLILIQIKLLLNFYKLSFKFLQNSFVNPIIKFLNYKYKNRFKHCLGYTTDFFFNDRNSFNILITAVFKKNVKFNKTNDKILIDYISEIRPGLIDENRTFKSKKDINDALELIITKIICDVDSCSISKICQSIFEKYSIKIKDLLTKKSFLILLNILVNQSIPNDDINEDNFDQIINEFCQKNPKLELFIDSSFFEDQYLYLVLVQIYLLLESNNLRLANPFALYINFLYKNNSFYNNNFKDCLFLSLDSLFYTVFQKLLYNVFQNSKLIQNKDGFLKKSDPNNASSLIYKIGLIKDIKEYKTTQSKLKFFELVITRLIHNFDPNEILERCKKLFKQYDITITKIKDLLTTKSFLSLISILVYKKIIYDDEIDFDKTIQEIKQKENLPIFINSTFFDDQKYQFLILAQIYLLFNFYHLYSKNPIMIFLIFHIITLM